MGAPPDPPADHGRCGAKAPQAPRPISDNRHHFVSVPGAGRHHALKAHGPADRLHRVLAELDCAAAAPDYHPDQYAIAQLADAMPEFFDVRMNPCTAPAGRRRSQTLAGPRPCGAAHRPHQRLPCHGGGGLFRTNLWRPVQHSLGRGRLPMDGARAGRGADPRAHAKSTAGAGRLPGRTPARQPPPAAPAARVGARRRAKPRCAPWPLPPLGVTAPGCP